MGSSQAELFHARVLCYLLGRWKPKACPKFWITLRYMHLDLPSSCSKVQIWSDCGPHFRAYAFVATAVDLLRGSAFLKEIYFSYFGEHHGKGRNDGQFGLQWRWLEDFAQRNVVSTCEHLLKSFKKGASHTMLSDPPPTGPAYEIVHFHPEKPRTYLYLDVAAKDLKIEYTYCWAVSKTTSKKKPCQNDKLCVHRPNPDGGWWKFTGICYCRG